MRDQSIFVLAFCRLAGQYVIGQTRFGMSAVLRQLQEIVESEIGLIKDGGKQCQVIATASLITELESVGTLDLSQHVAPVVIVLDKVALRESSPESNVEARNVDVRNPEVRSLLHDTFHLVIAKKNLV